MSVIWDLKGATGDNVAATVDTTGSFATSGKINSFNKIQVAGSGRWPFCIRLSVDPNSSIYVFHELDRSIKINEMTVKFDEGAGIDCIFYFGMDGKVCFDPNMNATFRNINMEIQKGSKLEFAANNLNATDEYVRVIQITGTILVL